MRSATHRRPAIEPASAMRIVTPGRNCWRVERADRFYCIQDAAEYFKLIRASMLAARRSVFVLGWDFASTLDLLPDGAPSDVSAGTLAKADAPTRLDELLTFITRRRPELNCHILTWDYGALYTLEREPLTRWRLRRRISKGLHFGFDDRHPIGASHHQKIVVVDDQLAFCGSIDLTSHRWDTTEHRIEEPARKTTLGVAYGPYHEVQAMVSGPAAKSFGVLARDRWRALEGESVSPLDTSHDDLWPAGVVPDLTNVDVAIARTIPGSPATPAVRECEALVYDSIAAAADTIYIENQYFSDERVARALAARLQEPDGPEVIVVVPRDCTGWLERQSMGVFREAALTTMKEADRHGRLRLLCPMASRAQDVPTFIHSKVMTIDDTFLRIGSANLARRSMGVDTECDLALEATDQATSAGVRRIRDRLIAEHLGLSPEDVTRGIKEAGSLRRFIDQRQDADRTLVPMAVAPPTAAAETMRELVDPAEPIGSGTLMEGFVPPSGTSGRGSPLRIWILPMAAVVLVAAFSLARTGRVEFQAFQNGLASLPETPLVLDAGVALFVGLGLLLVPVELLTIAAAIAFGTSRGAAVTAISMLVVATIGYAAGRALGPARLAQWIHRRSYRSIRQLGAQGAKGVAILHLSTVASAGAIHLACGAARLAFPAFLLGTAAGLVPVVAALIVAGKFIRTALLAPSLDHVLAAIGTLLALIVIAGLLRGVLLIRRFASFVSSHHQRAEFG